MVIDFPFPGTVKRNRDRSGSSKASAISSEEIEDIIKNLKFKRFQHSTRVNYFRIWRLFNEFFVKLDMKPESWEARLTLFVGFLIHNKKKSNTIKSYVFAIRAILYDTGIELSMDACLISSLTRACRLKNDRISTKLVIRKELLNLILDKTEDILAEKGQVYLITPYKAIFMVAYYGLLRMSEISEQHAVKAIDVHIAENKKRLLFVLRSSKTHTIADKPQLIHISAINDNHSEYCPFKCINDYLEIRPSCKSINEHFFIFQDRSPIKAHHIRAMLHEAIKKGNLNSKLYGFQGFHAGRASDMLKYGVSVETIKKLGRLWSNAVYKYLH